MFKKIVVFFSLFLFLAISFSSQSLAVLHVLTVQGRLMRDNVPITEETSVDFAIYDRMAGGVPLWSSEFDGAFGYRITPDANGFFTEVIGGDDSALEEEFLGDNYFLEI